MAERDETGRFLPGNRIWEMSPPGPGRPPKFKTQKALWEAAVAYFEWVTKNPLKEAKAFSYEGRITIAELPKMRAMTINGLCLSLGISTETWRGWKTDGHELFRKDLLPIIERIEAVIYEQKFTGAAAELLNPSIIQRELGLADRKELTGAGGGPIQAITRTVVDPRADDDA